MPEELTGRALYKIISESVRACGKDADEWEEFDTLEQAALLDAAVQIREQYITPRQKQISAVKGAIIGSLAGGHLDATPGYSRGILLQIAVLLDIELPHMILSESEQQHRSAGKAAQNDANP